MSIHVFLIILYLPVLLLFLYPDEASDALSVHVYNGPLIKGV
jgi:hypothetical protein